MCHECSYNVCQKSKLVASGMVYLAISYLCDIINNHNQLIIITSYVVNGYK